MDGGELLERSHSAESGHRPFPSSKWKVRVLRAIVQPAASFLSFCRANLFQGSAIRTKAICDDDLGSTMLSHCFLEEFQCSFFVTCLGNEAFQHLTLVVDSSPEVVPLPVDLHEDFVQVPLPTARLHPLDPAFPDLVGKNRAEPPPPEADGFMAYVDAPFMQNILDIPQ